MISDEAGEYFRSHAGFKRAFLLMRRKYQSYGRSGGTVELKDPTPAERTDLGGYFGRVFSHGSIRFTLSAFEKNLAYTKFAGCSLYEILCAYYQEKITTNQERKAKEQQYWSGKLEELKKDAAAIDPEGFGRTWAEGLDTAHYKADVHLFPDEKSADEALRGCIRAAHILYDRKGPVRLSVLAMEAMNDPHGLDRSCPAGRLFLRILQMNLEESIQLDGEGTLDLYIRNGIRPDDISSFTVVQGLHFYDEKGLHPAYEGHLEKHEYYLLSLSQLQNITACTPVHCPVYIIENQMVYADICSHLPDASIICTSGQMKTASLLTIDLLAEKKTPMYYSSDLDPEGIQMADRLIRRHPDFIHPWHMSPEDYMNSMSGKDITGDKRLKMLAHVSDPVLKETAKKIQQEKRAGYQEKLIAEMIEDIRRNQI